MGILNKAFDSTWKYVAAHPVESVGLALIAAYLISRLAP
jgi:hypothetical protein